MAYPRLTTWPTELIPPASTPPTEGVRQWPISTHMTPDTADRWLDAWILEATGRGLPKDGAYWQAGWD